MILWANESVWLDALSQNTSGSLLPIFHGSVIFALHVYLDYLMYKHNTYYLGIMSQYDLVCDPKTKVGHWDLYFMVQRFCLIS